MRYNSQGSISVDKKNLYIRLDGTTSRKLLLDSLDEIVEAAINSESNFSPKPAVPARNDVSLFVAVGQNKPAR